MKSAISFSLVYGVAVSFQGANANGRVFKPVSVPIIKSQAIPRQKRNPLDVLPFFNNEKLDVAGTEASSSGSSSSTHDDASPLLLRPWIRLYRGAPKVCIPHTNIDIAFTIASAMVLTCIDYGSAQLLQLAGWPGKSKHTRAVAGSIATIFHSTVLVLGLGAALLTQKYDPSGMMDEHPDWWQDGAHALIEFCTGYMIYDAAVQFVADRWKKGVGPVLSAADYMFLGHHAATSLYMVSARLCQAGHMSAMILMFTGELTAPIMNVLRISRTAMKEMTGDCCGRSWLGLIGPYAEYLFALLYAGFRIVIGPICAAHLTYDILLTKKGRKNVPVALSTVWLLMVWGVLFGSIPWIKTALTILQAGLNTGDSTVSASMGAE
mmetsp:Transcript_6090/g.13281  ORF Transcript_6090/g.13281 Transcript_6090/m.13281 type:complete len:378 (-) Transcript_6090:32-1165(-)